MANKNRIALLHLVAAVAQCCKVREVLDEHGSDVDLEIDDAVESIECALRLLRRREDDDGKRT